MNVKLVSWTNQPKKVIYWAFMNMHNKIPDNLDEIDIEQEKEFFDVLFKQPHQTVFEYVNTVWYFEDVSRSFQQQLTRTRLAAYSNQSLRIVNVGKFFDNNKYKKSSTIISNKKFENEYDKVMKQIQDGYNKLINIGCPVEDAREILPLGIYSPCTQSINLRSLYHMLSLRFCKNTQEEFRIAATLMKAEVAKKLGKIFTIPMVPLCYYDEKCKSPVPCGQYQSVIKGDVSKWIKG
jgi:thymidylate synthase (FAD)